MMLIEPDDWLPSHADYIRERTERENAHGISWSEEFSVVARRKLGFIYDDFFEEEGQTSAGHRVDQECYELLKRNSRRRPNVRRLWDALYDDDRTGTEIADWFASVPHGVAKVRAVDYGNQVVDEPDYTPRLIRAPEEFYEQVNNVLLEERVGWLYLEGKFRKRDNQPLHLVVIQPVEVLLSSDPLYASAERAYVEASTALGQGSYGSAVSLTYSAVQETFQALGARGGDLGALFNDAKNKGFLRGVDGNLLTAIKALDGWLTGNRSNRGNSHGASDADRDDAQLSIHVAAALMIRLMKLNPSEVPFEASAGPHD